GEKFGGWPGTKEWVYERGWLDQFTATINGLVEGGEVLLSTLSNALDHVPSGGIAYLPTASYREMEGWSLPPDAALRLIRLERDLGEARLAGPDGALIRGAHWRNFLVKYSESNRMHKKMMALSLLCRRRGDPPAARRAVGRAQCNDAYWHGVFGGLYLPHLREAIWSNLALAESELRRGEPLAVEVLDLDGDGHDEIWIHSDRFSALLSPRRGGALEEYTIFATGMNYANTLTRRREAYHDDLEEGLGLEQRPPIDPEPRAIFIDRVLPAGLTLEQYAGGDYWPTRSWAQSSGSFTIEHRPDSVEIVCSFFGQAGDKTLEKKFAFETDGTLRVSYRWDGSIGPPEDLFAPELSIYAPLHLRPEPAAETWTFPIETVAKSERGLDRTRQGESVTFRWPVRIGTALVVIGPAASVTVTPASAEPHATLA
ncbi:MAG: 4-alpha-glucanotransferase, partial [Gemmatimonadales bacterium]|nr:4-alpha-glucanotransferase [Gemmatimonadales bacterium]